MKKQEKKESAITLIALVITIIILLILLGISITALTQTNLFKNAKEAKQKTENAQDIENETLASYEEKIIISTNGSRETSSSKIFLDTSNIIGCVGKSTDWCNDSYSYTATEDCAILGRVGCNNGNAINILINSVDVGQIREVFGGASYVPINYYIKKGDTIEIKNSQTGSGGFVEAYAYGLK